MIDPITLSLITQGALGAFQLGKGLLDSKKIKRPDLSLLSQNLRDRERIYKQAQQQEAAAKERARFGFDQNTMASMTGSIEDSYRLGLNNLINAGISRGQFFANQGGLGALRARNMNDMYSKDYQQKMNNILYADQRSEYAQQQLANIAQSRKDIYGEQMREFQEKAGAARALTGAGIQNLSKGLRQWGSISQWKDILKSNKKASDTGNPTSNTGQQLGSSIASGIGGLFSGGNNMGADVYSNSEVPFAPNNQVYFPGAGGYMMPGEWVDINDPALGNIFQLKRKGGKITGKIGSYSSMIPAYMFQKMQNGGLVPVNIEKNELLSTESGEIIDEYSDAPPHPKNGKNPKGNRLVPEGSYIVPKKLMEKFINATKSERKKMLENLPQ